MRMTFMRLPKPTLALFLLLAASLGCASETTSSETFALIDGQPEAVGVLAFLNAETTTFGTLDQRVRLDRRAAEGLIAHRDGPDGVFGTRDDRPFRTIDEVLAVRWVGPASLQRILDYALANGFVPDGDDLLGVYDGVPFTVDEATATLRVANSAAEATLRHDVGLQTQAIRGILEARPIPSVLALSSVRYVGPVGLERLRAYALSVPPPVACATDADCDDARCRGAGGDDAGICRHDDELLGVFDGVSFTLGEADATLIVANLATQAQIQSAGLTVRAAENVLAARPLASIPALASVPWVGPASLERLRDFARANPALVDALATPAPEGRCRVDADCAGDDLCAGRLPYGDDRTGECTPRSELRGEGWECSETQHCAPGAFCTGLTMDWGWGYCNPSWMQASYDFAGFTVPAASSTSIDFRITGLASVPVDLVLSLRDTGPSAPVTLHLENPYGSPTPAWDPTRDRPLEGHHILYPWGDEAVNGRWFLHVENAGDAPVTFGPWSLFVSSRWD
ncbi:MAG: hypothetical protein KF901_19565 [Myxococcales bacterium]|nr:hypothetical protein [Myxococcales bacterium]